MDFSNYKSVPREVSEKYLNYLLLADTRIDSDKVNELIEDIIYTCEKLKLPESKKYDLMLVREWVCGRVDYKHISWIYREIKTGEDFICYFAKLILENETRMFTNFELFKMQSDIARLERSVSTLEARSALYR